MQSNQRRQVLLQAGSEGVRPVGRGWEERRDSWPSEGRCPDARRRVQGPGHKRVTTLRSVF